MLLMSFFVAAGAFFYHFRYVSMVVAAFIEGPIVMVATGFFAHQGVVSLIPSFIVLFFGDFVADIAWYWIGYYWARPLTLRFGKYLGLHEEAFAKVEDVFRRHHEKILLISKLTMGFGFAVVTLLTAGATKISFKKYAAFNFFGGLVWVSFLMGVGYYFGRLYQSVAGEFRIITMIGAIGFFGIMLYGFSKTMRQRFS